MKPLAFILCVLFGPSSPLIAQERPEPFAQFFTLPDITFSAEQQAKIDELKKEYVPKFQDSQKKWDGVITPEQLQQQREAFQKARSEGKQGAELRKIVNDSLKLTEEQLKQRAALQQEREQLMQQLRTALVALLTEEQRTRINQPRRVQEVMPPTKPDVKYGPHARNIMDIWLAKSEKPTPVLVSIHGGGFRAGDRSVSPDVLRQCLDAGISVVAITYRFSSDAIAPASFLDSARAIQFIRYNAKEWNIDPTRIAATGGSAGAGLSLWLGFHDDLADSDNEDPVLRESTRLTCMFVSGGQSSYDPRFIRELFPDTNTYQHPALAMLYDVDLNKLDELPEEKYKLFEECSPITHLTKDDVPAMLLYPGGFDQEITNQGIGIHHAKFGVALKEKMDALGIRCIVIAGREVRPAGESTSPLEFLLQEFKMTE